MEKIISCICLSIFICISILKPINVYAYQPSDQYISGPITDEEYEDLITAGGLASILASGAEIVVPEAGIADLLLDIYNYALDSEIGNAIWEYCTNPEGLKRDANTIRYYFKGQPNYLEDQGNLGLSVLLGTLGEDFQNQYEVNDESIETNPDVNYLPYIELINGKTFNYTNFLSDNWITTLSNANVPTNAQYSINGDLASISYCSTTFDLNPSHYNNSNYKNSYICSFYDIDQSYSIRADTVEPTSIYINFVDNVYQVTTSTIVNKSVFKSSSNQAYYSIQNYYYPSTGKFENYVNGSTVNNQKYFSYSNASLENCFKVIAMNWRNVNIYVNGDPWSVASAPPEPIQIGGNTYITGTDTPIIYSYPNGSWFDPAYLLHLLEEIDYNTKHTLSWIDIAPAFFDDNDQMALYTISIHRNDYDNLILEQYGSNRITQSKGLLFPNTELQPYTNTSAFITNSGINLIPSDILTVLGGCGVLILIAYLINRLLE